MKSFLKKILSVFLTSAILLGNMSLGVVWAEEEIEYENPDGRVEEEYEEVEEEEEYFDPDEEGQEGYISEEYEGERVAVDLNFEDYVFGSAASAGLNTMSGGTFQPEKIDDEHGVSLGISTGTSGYFIKKLPEPVSSGSWLITYDYYATATDGISHLRLVQNNESGTLWETFGRKANKVGLFAGLTNFTQTLFKQTFKTAKWYEVDLWLDFDNRKISLYLDNVYVESLGLPEAFTGVKSLRFTIQSQDSTKVNVFDNIRMVRADAAGVEMLKTEGKAIPEEIAANLMCSISTVELGNIFYNTSSAEVDVSLKNKLSSKYKGKAVYTVKSSTDRAVWSYEEKVDIAPGKTHSIHLTPDKLKYDIYTLNVSVYPESEAENVFVYEREFSIARKMLGNVKNKKFGVNTHLNKLDRTQPVGIPSLGPLGVGYIRDGIQYTHFYDGKEYGLKGTRKTLWEERILPYAEENDIDIMIMISGFPNPLTSETNVELIKEFAKQMGTAFKGTRIKAFELENEINLRFHVHKYPFERYAALIKAFSEGMKEVYPEAIIVGCTTARADAGWVEGVLRAGGGEYLDAVSCHPYQGSGSPETMNWITTANGVKKRVQSYGYDNIQVWGDECNTSSSIEWNSEQQQGENLIRHFALMDEYAPLDKFIMYQYQTNDLTEKDNEASFGIIRGWDVDNRYGAKPAFLAVSNYNAMTENTEYKEIIQEDNIYLYRYESTVDNTNTIMMYADRDCVSVSLKLGAKEGVLYDIYGNETKLYSDNGIFTFMINDSPCYFKSASDSFERVDSTIKADKTIAELPVGKYGEFNLSFDGEFDFEISARDTVNAAIEKNQSGLKVSVKPEVVPETPDYFGRIHNDGRNLIRDYVTVTLKKNGKNYAVLPLAVNYLENAVEASLTFRPYNDFTTKHFIGEIKIRNIADYPISGTLVMSSPTAIAEAFGEKKIEKIAPDETVTYKFNIPSTLNDTKNKYNGIFKCDTDGKEYRFDLGSIPHSNNYSSAGSLSLNTIHKAEAAPTIDGVFNKSEWGKGFLAKFGENDVEYNTGGLVIDGVVEQATEAGRKGVKSDFGGELYLLWDEEYLYAAAVVNDDIHFQKQAPVGFNKQDVFYVRVVPTTTQRHDTRFDFALSEFYGKPWCYLNWSQVWESNYTREFAPGEENVYYHATRTGITNVYEVKIPWKKLIYGGVKEYDNMNVLLSVRDYDEYRDKSVTFGGWSCLVR